jgi:hypothetical protein
MPIIKKSARGKRARNGVDGGLVNGTRPSTPDQPIPQPTSPPPAPKK